VSAKFCSAVLSSELLGLQQIQDVAMGTIGSWTSVKQKTRKARGTHLFMQVVSWPVSHFVSEMN